MGGKVLIVDDAASVRERVKAALISGGYEVVEATDGIEGLEQIKKHSDLVACVSDVQMPNLDGLDMLEQARESGWEVPVVMLTTQSAKGVMARAQALEIGCWLSKPFDPAVLTDAIDCLVED